MIVRKVWIPSASGPDRNFTVELSKEALNPEGKVFEDFQDHQVTIDPSTMDPSFTELVQIASMCNVATQVFGFNMTIF